MIPWLGHRGICYRAVCGLLDKTLSEDFVLAMEPEDLDGCYRVVGPRQSMKIDARNGEFRRLCEKTDCPDGVQRS